MNRLNKVLGSLCGFSLSFGLFAGQSPVSKLNQVFISYEEHGNAQDLVKGFESLGVTPSVSLKRFLMKGESPVAPRIEELSPSSYLVHLRNDDGAVVKSFSMDFSARDTSGVILVNGSELNLANIESVEHFQKEMISRLSRGSEHSFLDIFFPSAMANSNFVAGVKDLGWQIAVGGLGIAGAIWGALTGRKVVAGLGAGAATWAFISGVSKHGELKHESEGSTHPSSGKSFGDRLRDRHEKHREALKNHGPHTLFE